MFLPYTVDVPMKRLPWANWALIVVTIAVTVSAWCGAFSDEPPIRSWGDLLRGLRETKDEKIQEAFASLRKRMREPPPLSLQPKRFSPELLVTSMFAHAGIIHLVLNMVFLFAFGNAVNAKLGHGTFLGVYFLAGIFGGLAWILFGDGRPALGASGAIMGILGVFLMLFPKNDVVVWATFAYRYAGTVYIPAAALIGSYLLSDLVGVLLVSRGGVAYLCHLGGALTGIAVATILIATGRVQPTRYEENLLQTLGIKKKPLQFEEAYWEERDRMWEERKKRGRHRGQSE